MEKVKLSLFKLIYIGVFIFTFFTIILEFKQSDFQNGILGILAIFLYIIPLISKKIKNIFPVNIRCIFILYVFSTIILGEVNIFYEIIPVWDDILHIVQGFFVGWIGLIITFILFKDKNINMDKLRPYKIYIILFSICLSMTVGSIWEMLEYTVDCNMNVDMQKDNYVYKFNSILLNPKKDNEVMVIDNIGYTTIYDKSGNKVVTFNGYLDIGNKDTMDDLIDTFIGSITFCVIGWFYLSNKKVNVI